MVLKTNVFIVIMAMLMISSCQPGKNEKEIVKSPPTDSLAESDHKSQNLVFGIPSDSFSLVTGHIKQNGFLSSILLEHGVSMQDIDQVTRNSKLVFDVRNIRSGNSYTLFCDTDSMARARFLVYEYDATTSYIFSLRDSLNITPFRKEIVKVIRYSSGTIETSMWDAMIASGLHPGLAVELSNIFAWTVDFFGLQKGDSFKVIYEEKFIDGKSIGIGKVFGAQFIWSGKTINAVPFIQDGRESYFDSEGNSLRKAFLKAPLSFSRISSRFSSSRLHPILRIRRPHYGVDYAAPIGTPVYAVGDGRVVSATIENGSGKMVRISHNSVYSTAYLHLSRWRGHTCGSSCQTG
jgi:murein DD-endopeptidase MepM/ murein hydrolase activator NlpD